MTKAKLVRAAAGIAIGIAVTAALAWLSRFAHGEGADTTARALFWQNTLMQSFIPPHNIGTLDRPFYEATPLNVIAYLISYPVGAIIYGSIAYVVLSRPWKRS